MFQCPDHSGSSKLKLAAVAVPSFLASWNAQPHVLSPDGGFPARDKEEEYNARIFVASETVDFQSVL